MSDSQGPMVSAIAIAFAVITVFVLVLRLFARIFLVRCFGFDDAMICLAACCAWAFSIVTVMAVDRGLGSRYDEVILRGQDNFTQYSFYVWLSSIFYNACLGCVKISVLSLYMRLGDKWLRKLSMVMIGVVACQAGGNVLACIFQCSPVAGAYDYSVRQDDKCVNVNAFYLANAAVNIFTDLLTYTLPIRLILNLQIPQRQKMGLAVILSLGLIACVSSIIRITYVPPMLNPKNDATWVISPPMYWSVIETNIAILAASIPSYKTVAKKYAPRLLGSSSDKTKSKTTGNLSGFHKMDDRNMGLQSLDRSNAAKKSMGIDTYVERGSEDNNSSQRSLAPTGHIGVKTHIETHYT